MNILIAEDAQETREALKNIILLKIDDSVTIFEANDGKEAIAILKEHRIDILLTDIMMPETNGFKLIKYVKSSDLLEHIFIVAITGLTAKSQVKKIFLSGADYYIPKPIQQEDIVARLKLVYALVKKNEVLPTILRDTFNPFDVLDMNNYYIIFTILQEEDLYQIINSVEALNPSINKFLINDLITLMMKSYEKLNNEFEYAFEIMYESSKIAVYLTCTNLSYINAIKKYDSSLPNSYAIKYLKTSMTIKIPTMEK